ncbi:MAG: NUDIX hydrolase [Actinobacteria bacterium]|nr:NUDIX hydrolase [Actinomycetota bacterium]
MADLGKGDVVRAAGGVLWRREGNARPGHDGPGNHGVEVALVHRPRYDDWSLPKGKLGPGENDLSGAIREVLEETGHRVRLGRPLGAITYLHGPKDSKRPKVVRYWAMQAAGGAFVPSKEVDEIAWTSIGDALSSLTHDRDREVLERFALRPVQTGTLLLVRHASAGSRSKWKADDRLRPLDDLGLKQAAGLCRLLAPLGIQELISADYVRCVQTLEPLARLVGLPIEPEPLFSETGWPGREREAIALLRALGKSRAVTAVCSQGNVIPDVLTALVGKAGERHAETKTKKGSVWVLSFDDGAASAEYIPPPA